MKIALILGTRPEIIKMSPIIQECQRQQLEYLVIHTGQHYSYEMDRVFFENFNLPSPKYNLNVGSGTHAEERSSHVTTSCRFAPSWFRLLRPQYPLGKRCR